jgi:hypothetical protein
MRLYPTSPPECEEVGNAYVPDDPAEPPYVRWSGRFGFMDFTPAEARAVATLLSRCADEAEAKGGAQ